MVKRLLVNNKKPNKKQKVEQVDVKTVNRYAEEMEQCCVTEENIDFDFSVKLPEGEKFARKCDATGEPMNEGWCIGDGEYYAKYEKDVLAELSKRGYASLSSAYEDDVCYWTEWDNEDDFQYVVKDGELVEIE